MRDKLPPRPKHIDEPPVLMSTWIVRCYAGDRLRRTVSLATEKIAHAAANHWREAGEANYAEVELIRQERKLR